MSTSQCKHGILPLGVGLSAKAFSSSVARKTFEGAWRKVTPQERGKMLVKLADLLDEHAETIACIEALDNGKSVTMAMGDVAAASGCIRYYGGWADKIEGKVVDTTPDTFNYIKKEPVSHTSDPGDEDPS